MAGTVATKIHGNHDLHETFLLCLIYRQAVRFLFFFRQGKFRSQLRINQSLTNAAHTENISVVPDAARFILGEEFPAVIFADIDIVKYRELLIIHTAKKLPRFMPFYILVYVLRINLRFWMVRVQIPEEFTPAARQGTVKSLLDGIVMVQVYLRCNPHAIGITTDFFER